MNYGAARLFRESQLYMYFTLLFQDVLWQGGKKESVMKNTIKKLPVNLSIPFLTEVC